MNKTMIENPLRTEPISKLLKEFTIPAIISMVINAVYNIVDQIFLGQLIGPEANAATTIAFPIFMIIMSIAVLFGIGNGIYISTRLGERNYEQAQKAFTSVFNFITIAAIVITIFGIIFIRPLLYFFGADTGTYDNSFKYTSVILLGTWANMMLVVMDKVLRADNAPKKSMQYIVFGAILNTILDPIFIKIFGISGAAIATILSQFITATLMIIHVQKNGNLSINIKKLFNIKDYEFSIMKSAMYLGLSSFILQISNIFTQIVMNRSLLHYGNLTPEVGGTIALASMGVVIKIYFILTSICVGIGVGFQPIVSFNIGAKQYERVYEAYKKSALYSIIVTFIGGTLVQLFPHIIISIFDSTKGSFYNFSIHALRIYMISSFIVGIQIVNVMYFQAIGNPIKAAILSLVRQILILIPAIIILPIFFGLDGILYSGPLSEIVTFIVSTCLIIKGIKELKEKISNSNYEKF